MDIQVFNNNSKLIVNNKIKIKINRDLRHQVSMQGSFIYVLAYSITIAISTTTNYTNYFYSKLNENGNASPTKFDMTSSQIFAIFPYQFAIFYDTKKTTI